MPTVTTDMTRDEKILAARKLAKGGTTVVDIARALSVTRVTVHRWLAAGKKKKSKRGKTKRKPKYAKSMRKYVKPMSKAELKVEFKKITKAQIKAAREEIQRGECMVEEGRKVIESGLYNLGLNVWQSSRVNRAVSELT